MIHLHCHTTYSLLDGMISPDKLVESAKTMGMSSVAITDHGSISGAIKFYKACEKNGVRPIIGIEAYFVDDVTKKEKGEKRLHVCLLAKTAAGFYNFFKLMSEAHKNLYYKPRIDMDLLEDYGDDFIVMTACANGLLAHPNVERLLRRLNNRFPGDVYLEVMPIAADMQKEVNQKAEDLHRRHGLPIVATNDIHYLRKEDRKYHDFLLKMTKDFQFDVSGLWMKSADDMVQSFKEIGHIDSVTYKKAIDTTEEIANKIDIVLEKRPVRLPSIGHGDADGALYDIVSKRKKKIKDWNHDYDKRLEYEINIIKEKKYSDYLLLVDDIVTYAKENGFQMGYGRGSSAGSLLCYTLGITGIDPIKDGLLFERFLNPLRGDYPDIDLDFQRSKRGEIIEYIKNRWGRDHVAQIRTFSELKPKAALKDVLRYYDIPFFTANKITELVNNEVTIADSVKSDPALKRLILEANVTGEMIDLADHIVGGLRHYGVHAAGVVVCPDAVVNYGIVEVVKKEEVINWDMEDVEFFGLVKIDILGLSALDKFAETINRAGGVDWENVDWTRVWREFSKGNTVGIFQFESDNVTQFMMKLGSISDRNTLIDVNALVRPGPFDSGQADMYVKRYNGEPVESKSYGDYISEIVGDTYGVIVYQEQVIRLLTSLAGYTIPEADIIRKLIAKSYGPEELEKHRGEFLKKLKKTSKIPNDIGDELWDDICAFGRYSFNKSHAAAYTELAVRQMYLKVSSPSEFMLGQFMWTEKEDKQKKFIIECKRLGIDMRPPDINCSDVSYSLVDGDLHIGLSAIKGVGPVAIKHILKQRQSGPYEDIEDFRIRVDRRKVNKGVVIPLVKSGCFDFCGVNHKKAEEYYDLLNSLYDYCAGNGAKDFDPASVDVLYDPEGDYSDDEKMMNMLSLMPGAYSLDVEAQTGLDLDVERLNRLQWLVEKCKQCALWKFYKRPVAFDYSTGSSIMVVGEAPGFDEWKEGKPFVGKAGKKLIKKLRAIGIARDDLYITNVYKCRPDNNKLPASPPKICHKYLKKEIEILRPKLVVALGNTPLEFFSGRKGGIKSRNGQIIVETIDGMPVPVLYCIHPAALLYDSEENEPLFDAVLDVIYRIWREYA